MIQMDFDINGTMNDILRLFGTIDYNPFYTAVGNIMENAVMAQFKSHGAYFQRGMPWMPLAASTIKDRQKKGFTSDDILIRHGGDAGLMGSIHSMVNGNNVNTGTNKFYAPFLHSGTKRMPARIIFPTEEYGFPPDLFDQITTAYEKFIKSRIGN